jgi:hypothetical protein
MRGEVLFVTAYILFLDAAIVFCSFVWAGFGILIWSAMFLAVWMASEEWKTALLWPVLPVLMFWEDWKK